MGRQTKIQFCDATHNFWYGCEKVSAGCAACYMFRMFDSPRKLSWFPEVIQRTAKDGRKLTPAATKITLREKNFDQPLHWKEPLVIFINDLSDFFDERVPRAVRLRAFEVMRKADWHVYLLITKRVEVALRYKEEIASLSKCVFMPTCENQRMADQRLPLAFQIPARWHGVSVEPLLGPVDIRAWLYCKFPKAGVLDGRSFQKSHATRKLDWVIVGGESGGPEHRSLVEKVLCCRVGVERKLDWRPKIRALQWVRYLRDQCVDSRVPFFFKQWGGPRPDSGGRLLGGKTWDEKPDFFGKESQRWRNEACQLS